MPWAKGQSGNAKGKPKGAVSLGLRELREKARKKADKALATLEKLMSRGTGKGATDRDRQTARAAANDMLTWGFGRPSPWPEDGIPPDIARLPAAEQLEALRGRRDVYQGAIEELERRVASEAPPTTTPTVQ